MAYNKPYWSDYHMGEEPYLNSFHPYGGRVLWVYVSLNSFESHAAGVLITQEQYQRMMRTLTDSDSLGYDVCNEIFENGYYDDAFGGTGDEYVVNAILTIPFVADLAEYWYKDGFTEGSVYDYIEDKLIDAERDGILNVDGRRDVDSAMEYLSDHFISVKRTLAKVSRYL